MSSQKYLAVYIGRFNSVTKAHVATVEHAAKFADSILMLPGSAYRPRSFKNPLTFSERKSFIEANTDHIDVPITILPLIDTLYDDEAWKTNVRTAVKMHMRASGMDPAKTKVVLVGFEKDKSSLYLSWFPGWDIKPTKAHLHDGEVINATDLRRAIFLGDDLGDLSSRFGEKPVQTIQDWAEKNPAIVASVREEGIFNRKYKAGIAKGEAAFGYPIQINCADAVVIQNGHILLVKRDLAPGRGLYALPGGHIGNEVEQPDGTINIEPETAMHAAIRELYEETRLDMPRRTLRSAIKGSRVFDHPERSERGWVRTEAFLFQLQNRPKLEKVRGGSDAADAFWVPLTDLTPNNMFEDHFDIVQAMAPGAVPFTYSSLLLAHS
jgi:bifunctional NMN adenylyltransferase/nudix hydrolase